MIKTRNKTFDTLTDKIKFAAYLIMQNPDRKPIKRDYHEATVNDERLYLSYATGAGQEAMIENIFMEEGLPKMFRREVTEPATPKIYAAYKDNLSKVHRAGLLKDEIQVVDENDKDMPTLSETLGKFLGEFKLGKSLLELMNKNFIDDRALSPNSLYFLDSEASEQGENPNLTLRTINACDYLEKGVDRKGELSFVFFKKTTTRTAKE